MIETWKDIPGYEGAYMVSNFGRVKSLPRKVLYKGGPTYALRRERVLALPHDKDGYCIVSLKKGNVRKTHKVHRLVAEAFLNKKHGDDQVNHKDGVRHNNLVSNLEWCSCKQNIRHKFDVLGYTQKDIRRGRLVTVLSNGNKYCSVKSAARALQVNPQTIRNWASAKAPKVVIS